MFLTEFLTILITLVLFIYFYIQFKYNYWSRKGIKQLKPKFLYGNVKESLLLKKCEAEIYEEIYKQCPDEPAIGIYKILTPLLFVKCPQLVKQIMVSEFDSFRTNDVYYEKDDLILGTHPFSVIKDKWKRYRTLSSVSFTTAKIKAKVPNMVEVCKEMVQYLKQFEVSTSEGKYFAGTYATNVSMRTIFGIADDSFSNSDSIFRKMNIDAYDESKEVNLQYVLGTYFPSICRFLRLRMTPKGFSDFYMNVVKEIHEDSKKNPPEEDNFVLRLIQNSKDKSEVSTFEIAGLACSMMWDAYGTSSVLMGHTLYYLAKYPEIQNDLRKEINETIDSLDDINYQTLDNMIILQAFISEVLRLRPPVATFHKECTKKITLESCGRQYILEPGVKIMIPVWSIQNDKQHFDNPEEFNIERFLNGQNYEAYFPFGLGPRACLGSKYAMIQTKAFLVSLIKYFRLEEAEPNKPVIWDENSGLFLLVKGGMHIRFKRISNF